MKPTFKNLITVLLFLSGYSLAQADPQLSSWFTVNSGKTAAIYRTDAEKNANTPETTWSNGRLGQNQPAYDGIQEILFSSNWIYIRGTGLGSHVMGPWYMDNQHRRLFPNLPVDQNFIFAFPRHPVVQTSQRFNPLGEIGVFVDGVRMFDANDAFSYSNRNGQDADPRAGIGHGDRIWNRDAYVNESITFDAALGHQQQTGVYHYHAEPLALRYLLGYHVDCDAATKTYHESAGPPVIHSPILGWMRDGYSIYGPYGYSNPTNPTSEVRRMVSGFVLRNGQNGSDNLDETGRKTLPAWDARELHRSTVLSGTETGPNVSGRYPLGHYIEDYAYLGDLGKAQGKDFDLDELNGRWCVTPEFPQGTYAYFTTIDAQGRPAYPYSMGRRYHGYPTGQIMNSIHEPVTTYFESPAIKAAQTPAASNSRTLVWNAATGGTYQPHP